MDASILVEFGRGRKFAEQLLQQLEPRMEGAAEFAESSRVVLGRASNGVDLDVLWQDFRSTFRSFNGQHVGR